MSHLRIAILVAPVILALSACGAEEKEADLTLTEGALSTTYSLVLGSYSAANTNSATVNTVSFDVGFLPKGTPVTLTTCGSTDTDTFLRLFDSSGVEVANNDDTGLLRCSTLNFTVTGTDRFTVRAGCWSTTACSGSVTAGANQTLAERWAPVLFQSTAADPNRRHDYITKVNYDGDYNGNNNWADLTFSPSGYMYYSVSETLTHYFIGYYFFYPQDTAAPHQNDLESSMMVVAKAGLYGILMDVVAGAHGHITHYPVYSGVTPGTDGSVGQNMVWFSSDTLPYQMANHIQLFSEANGHGIKSCGDTAAANCTSAPGVVYGYKGGISETPNNSACADGGQAYNVNSACGYHLISMDESGGNAGAGTNGSIDQGFWWLQNHICPTCTFSSWGHLPGGGAVAPWTGDAPDDGHSFAGDWLCDPAAMVDIHINGSGFDSGFSHTYVNHPYFTHSLQIDRLWNNGPTPDNLWFLVYPEATGTDFSLRVLDYSAYRTFANYSGPNNDGWHNFRYGGDAAFATGAAGTYGDSSWKMHTFCRPSRDPNERIHIQIRKGNVNASTVVAEQVYSPGNDNGGRINFSQANGASLALGNSNTLQFTYTRDPRGAVYP